MAILLLTACNKTIDNTELNQGKGLILDFEQPSKESIFIDIDNQVPILKSYLAQFDEPEIEMSRMQSTYLISYKQRDYFLLSYSCGTKICHQLLLEHYQGKIKSFEVSEASFLQDSKHSNNYLAFLFGRNEGKEVIRNQVVIVDLQNFRKMTLPEHFGILESFEYPIPSIEWKDRHLKATIAVLEDPSYDSIKEWNKNNKESTQELLWKIQ
ncbi:hypothetical protein [Cytobacillus sp.]|uniref:hypothetical protein n=1 Tax=Cytobacillus sp. TaxID=2675269 RepID=UPI0028BF05FB|nr:hypothetical protein [Cytobacillus sp.]